LTGFASPCNLQCNILAAASRVSRPGSRLLPCPPFDAGVPAFAPTAGTETREMGPSVARLGIRGIRRRAEFVGGIAVIVGTGERDNLP
jgi:hypothetical protein